MEMGIVGLSKVGKTTLFNLLTGAGAQTDKYARGQEINRGVARVPDHRLERLRELFKPRRFTPATVQYVDIPGLESGAGHESLDLAELRNVDALVHVVRSFDDPEVLHPDGSVDPARDVVNLDLELVLADHSVLERRLQRLAGAKKRGLSRTETAELALIEATLLPALEAERPLRGIELDPEEAKLVRGFALLTAKPLLVVLNVGEPDLSRGAELAASIPALPGTETIVVSAPIESEISSLDRDDQAEFLADLGLEEPGLDRVIRGSFRLLGLVSFFTVGEDEVRAWPIRRGTRARAAAGTIHSDLERGFIRAEVVPWDDLLRLGSLAAARSEGVLRLEGKEYEVVDGDIVHVRFNV